MASDGWRQVTIKSLCHEAKLNKRYFYESFEDLDALAGAVVDEISTRLVQTAFEVANAARTAGVPTEVLARDVMRAVIEYLTDDPRRARVLFTEVADSPRAIAHRRAAIHGLAQALSAYGHEHHAAKDATDPIAPLASSVLVGGSIEAILGWLDGAFVMSRDEFIEDLAALWVVTGDGAASRARARQAKASKPDRPPRRPRATKPRRSPRSSR